MACKPPVFLRTADASLHGVRTVVCNGDGYTVTLEWYKEYLQPSNWDLLYNIYYSTNQKEIYNEGVKFTLKPNSASQYLSFALHGYFDLGKQYYFLVRGAGHEPGTLIYDQLPDAEPGLKMYSESILLRNISATDMLIPVEDVSVFPSSGIVLIGAELIRYTNIDLVDGYLVVGERGIYGYDARSHTTDGYDGYHMFPDAMVRIWRGWESTNTAVGMVTIRFDEQYARLDGYGYRERVDIISGGKNLNVVDEANAGFDRYDLAGWRRTYLPDYLAGKCVGTYFGGEMGCADGYECDGTERGISVQDHMNMREEYLLEATGEPVMLFKRMWEGKESRHTSTFRENTTYRGIDTYGTSLVNGYEQYFSPRRSDGKILVRFGPTKEDFKRDEPGIENVYVPNCWTLVIPTIKDGDFIIRFNQDGTEEWRYEIIDVDRNRTLLMESGLQKFTAVRVRKTDPIYQVRSIRDTSTIPREILTSIGMVPGPGGIPAHVHRIIRSENINNIYEINQMTSVEYGHNHAVISGILQKVLDHTHTILPW